MALPIIIPNEQITNLIRTFNLQNVQVVNTTDNPYNGKIAASPAADPALYKSALGTPVVINLVFDTVTYTNFFTKQSFTTRVLQFDTILCTVSQAKKIIKTEIQGRDGTVKEYIGLDDYQVNINGIITGANGVHPADTVTELKKMLDAPVAIPVVSSFLNRLGIYSIVVNDYSIPQVAGGYSKQDFSINAISDAPLELQIV